MHKRPCQIFAARRRGNARRKSGSGLSAHGWMDGRRGHVLSCRMERTVRPEGRTGGPRAAPRDEGEKCGARYSTADKLASDDFRQTVAAAACGDTEMGSVAAAAVVGCAPETCRGLLSSSVFKRRQFLSPRGSKQIHKGSKGAVEA